MEGIGLSADVHVGAVVEDEDNDTSGNADAFRNMEMKVLRNNQRWQERLRQVHVGSKRDGLEEEDVEDMDEEVEVEGHSAF